MYSYKKDYKYIDDLDDCLTNNKIDQLYVNILKINKMSLHNYLRLGFKQISLMIKKIGCFFLLIKLAKTIFYKVFSKLYGIFL